MTSPAANREAHLRLVEQLRSKLAEAARGGSERARKRHVERGKLLPRDRVERCLCYKQILTAVKPAGWWSRRRDLPINPRIVSARVGPQPAGAGENRHACSPTKRRGTRPHLKLPNYEIVRLAKIAI